MAKPNKDQAKKTGWTAMLSGAIALLIASVVFQNDYIYLESYDFVILLDVFFQCLFLVFLAISLLMLFVSRISRIKHNKAKNAASPEANVTGPKDAQLSTASRKYKVLHTHDARQK